MIRLFVGLPIPENVLQRLAGLSGGLPGARWVQLENLHMTLRFIGDIERGHADDIHLALSRIAAPPVEVTLSGLDWFGSRSKVRTVVVKAEKAEALMHLQRKTESAVVRAGMEPEERKFLPHITLARLRDGRPTEAQQYCDDRAMFKQPPYRADRFVLYSSFLSHNGAIYTPEQEYALDG